MKLLARSLATATLFAPAAFAQSQSLTIDPATAPNPVLAWAMAIVFLGLVVMRRTRSPMP